MYIKINQGLFRHPCFILLSMLNQYSIYSHTCFIFKIYHSNSIQKPWILNSYKMYHYLFVIYFPKSTEQVINRILLYLMSCWEVKMPPNNIKKAQQRRGATSGTNNIIVLNKISWIVFRMSSSWYDWFPILSASALDRWNECCLVK